MSAIEFRVSGPQSKVVADELARLLKTRFAVTPTVQTVPAPAGEPGARVDPFHATVVLLELAILGFHVYETFVRKPAEDERQRLIDNWAFVVSWASSKLPTTVRAIIGSEEHLLHQCEAERLHHLTYKAAKDVSIVPE